MWTRRKSWRLSTITGWDLCRLMAPVYFRNQPVGCTATIMYQIYQEKQLEISPEIAGLLCAAIISDTLMFRSPTCTAVDQAAAESLAKIAGIDIPEFASEMFRAGSNLKDKTPAEIFHQDFKKFIIEDVTFGVGQINSMDARELEEIKENLLPNMQNECGKHGMQMVFFMLTNIIEESTELLYYGSGAKELIARAFEKEVPEESCRLEGVVSRRNS